MLHSPGGLGRGSTFRAVWEYSKSRDLFVYFMLNYRDFKFSAETPQKSTTFIIPACINTVLAPFGWRDLYLNTHASYDWFWYILYLNTNLLTQGQRWKGSYTAHEQQTSVLERHFLSPTPKDIRSQGLLAGSPGVAPTAFSPSKGFKASAT